MRGGRGGREGKAGKCPKRDKSDDKGDNKGDNDRKDTDFLNNFHCQQRGLTTENCLSNQPSDPPMSANTTGKALTLTASTLTTSIENYWMVASLNASSSDWFVECGCTTHISGRRLFFSTDSDYPPHAKKVNGYNGVTSCAYTYGSIRLACLLLDGRTKTITLHVMPLVWQVYFQHHKGLLDNPNMDTQSDHMNYHSESLIRSTFQICSPNCNIIINLPSYQWTNDSDRPKCRHDVNYLYVGIGRMISIVSG